MQRMFIDRKRQAKKRFARFATTVSIVFALFISLILVIILIYGERTIVEGDTVDIYLAEQLELEPESPPITEPPRVSTLQPLPDYSPEPDAYEEELEPLVPEQISYEDISITTAPEPYTTCEPEHIEAPITETLPQEDEPQPQVEESSYMLEAGQSAQAVRSAAQIWWAGISEIPNLSDDIVLSSFIADFDLAGAAVTTFEVSATSVEVYGTYNGGKFAIDTTFTGGGQGIQFVAWYDGYTPYAASWQSGSDEIKIAHCNGVRPRAIF